MNDLPPVRSGFVRLGVRLRAGEEVTPGFMASSAGVPMEQVGQIIVTDYEAFVEIHHTVARNARYHLDRVGQTRIAQWNWLWLKLAIGRNHGLTIGQLRKLMQTADASPLGRIHVNNTHSLVGLHDFNMPSVIAKLETTRINGFAVRPQSLEASEGPGSPAFVPQH